MKSVFTPTQVNWRNYIGWWSDFAMTWDTIYKKLFVLNAWSIGYRQINSECAALPAGEQVIDYQTVPINDHVYYADPFVVERGDSVYLFAESMNRYRGIGTLSVAKMKWGGAFFNISRSIAGAVSPLISKCI